MTGTLTALRVVMVAIGIGLLGVGYWVRGNRDARALRPFVVLVGVVGALAITEGLTASDYTALSIAWFVAYLAIPAAFTWFVVEYYGLPYLASWGQRVAFLAPLVVGFAGGTARVLSPAAVNAMAGGGMDGTPEYATLLAVAGFAEQVGMFYAGGLLVASTALVARTVAKYDHLDGRLGVVLSFVCVWPWLAYLVTPALVGAVSFTVVFGVTTAGYLASGAAAGFAVTRGGLFDAAPAAGTLGPETVLAELDDAVVVIDRTERVVRLNRRAVETFGVDPEETIGQPLAAVVGVDAATLARSNVVELDAFGGSRQFEATVSRVRDRLDRSPGKAIVLRDVTGQRVRAQRLAVLNRVVRHNLRNEMTAILGRAEIIAEEATEHADAAEAILDSADDLVELGERAHEVEEMMSAPPTVDSDIDLASLAGSVVDRYRTASPEASLSVDVDDSLTVTTDGRILSGVLDNLVENALVHNDAPTPVVTVSARADPGSSTVRLSVADNGPGIPEQERSVIEAGTESPLEHGSGLGLWAVNWGVTRIGGAIEFSENEPEGTVVTIELPESAEKRAAPSETTATPPAARGD